MPRKSDGKNTSFLRWYALLAHGNRLRFNHVGSHSRGSCPLFAACVVLSFIVMYDATGVRRSAGEQAKTLNQIISHLLSENQIPIDMTVREIFGHTPFQVLMGALLGIAMPLIFRVFF